MKEKLSAKTFSAIFWVLCITSAVIIVLFFPHLSLPSHIEQSRETDSSVLIAAILTLAFAALTLLISWYIKVEATEIGDKIIMNSVVHRYLDALFNDYTYLLIHVNSIQAFEKHPKFRLLTDEEKKGQVFVARMFASCKWLYEKFDNSENSDANNTLNSINNFLGDLMPGKAGKSFSELTGFSKNKEDLLEKLKSANEIIVNSFINRNFDTNDEQKLVVIQAGLAIYRMMRALGWNVPESNIEIIASFKEWKQTNNQLG